MDEPFAPLLSSRYAGVIPIAKAMKIKAVIARFMLQTLDKWRTLARELIGITN